MEDIDSEIQSVEELKIVGRTGLFWGAISQWFAIGVSILLGLVVTPIIIRKLGNEQYGLWGLAASFVGFYGLFDLGLGAAVSRFLGNAVGTRDIKRVNAVASTGKCLLSGTSLFVIIVAFLIMKPAQLLLRIPDVYTLDFRLLLALSAGSLAFSIIMSVYSGALLATEDFVIPSCIRIAANIIRSLGMLALVLVGNGVVGLAVANVFAVVLEQAAIFWRCRVRIPQFRASFSGFDWLLAKALFGFGAAKLAVSGAGLVRSKLDVMLVTRLGGLAQAGIYTVALTVFRYLYSASVSASGTTWPRLNQLHGAGKRAELQKFFLSSSHMIASCTSVLVGILVGLGPVLIRLWVGSGYEQSATVLRILVGGYFLDLATNPGIGSLYATARHRYYAYQTTVEAVASFTLALVLGIKFGMTGVAAGMVIPIVLVKVTVQPWYVTRNLSIGFWPYWVRTIAMTVLAAALLSAGLGSLEYGWAKWGWWSAPVITAATFIATGTVLWRLVLDNADRAMVLLHLKQTVDKLVSSRNRIKVFSTE